MKVQRSGAPGSALLAAAVVFGIHGSWTPAYAQQPSSPAEYVAENRAEIVRDLVDFASIPNVADDVANIRRNAEALLDMMEQRGIASRILETGGPPMVYGELEAPGAETTILIYAHYDGQPADEAEWVGHAPWKPILRRSGDVTEEVIRWPQDGEFEDDWRLFGRSVSDDKGPIVAMMHALDALRASGGAPSINLKFLFEGDEEIGSPHLPELIRTHPDLLRSDLVVVADGPGHASGRPTVVFGVRGITTAQITVFGADRPLHSGHYGNWAPNPAMNLARLLASMKDEEGRVTIDGWYEDVVPLSAAELEAVRSVPAEEPADFGFAEPEGGPGALRLERVALPSLNVRGMRSAWVGSEARTLVPERAVAELDLRLVPNIEPSRQIERLKDHVRKQGYHLVDGDPDAETRARHPRLARVATGAIGYPATRTPLDHPLAGRLITAVESGGERDPIVVPMHGGSVPMSWFAEILGTPVVLVPIANPDNNQHAANENLRLGNLFDAVSIYAAVMGM